MKPKITPEKAVPPKRRISRWEKEGKRRRIIAIIVAVVIVGILISGGVVAYVHLQKPWHEPVVKVNGRVFDMDYFVKMLHLYGATYDEAYDDEYNLSQNEQLITYVIDTIHNNEVLRQKAEEYDIDTDAISDEEIEEELKNLFGFDPEGEVSEEDFNNQVEEFLDERNVSRSTLENMAIVPIILREKLLEAVGDDEYPEDEELKHAQIRAVLIGTKDEALEIKDNWDGGFNQIIKDYSPTRYYPDGGYWLVMVYESEDAEEHEEEGLYINAILLATKEKADEVAGEFDGSNFADLAMTYSLDSSSTNGGDMGWMSLDSIEAKFGDLEAIEALELNTLSAPISENYPDETVEWLPAGIESSVFDEFVFAEGSETSGVSDPKRDTTYTTQGGYWLVMVYEPEDAEEHEEEGLYIKAILLDNKEEAENLKADIETGEDFAALAQENSLDSSSSSGGEIGWMNLDDIKAKFGEDYVDDVQNLALDTPSDPIYNEDVSKKSGYWLIEVLSKANRSLTEDNRDTLSQKAYNDILDAAMIDSTIKNYVEDDHDKLIWALKHL